MTRVPGPSEAPPPREVLILAVDDKPANLVALERSLASVPARLIKASSGEEALTACLKHQFALAILDVQMPGMDGYELAEILLSDPATARTPIIFLSAAYADEQHLFKGYTAGAVDYIVKPYDPTILLQKVRVFLELARYRFDLEQEVADRTRAQVQIEARYRSLFETMAQGVVYQDAAGCIIEANPAAARILGLPTENLRGRESRDARWQAIRPDGSAFPGDEHPAMVALRTGQRVNGVLMGLARGDDAKPVWISIDATPEFRPGEASPHRVYTTFSDVTERVLAEQALAESERALRAVFDGTRDGILAIDGVSHRIAFANDAVCRLLGTDRASIAPGAPVDRLLQPQDLDRLLEGLGAPLAAGVGLLDLELTRADGSTVMVDVNVAPLELGGRRCVLGVFRDTSERRRAEEERQRLQSELFRAQKMESIGALAGGVAHDFNNLLSVILGYIGFALARLAPDDPLRDDLLEVRRAGERSAVLTRQLLAFSRKQVMQLVPVDVNQITQGVEKLLGRIIGEDITLTLKLDEHLGVVHADPGQLEQVIMNLAVNARDAMPRGGALVVSTAKVELDAKDAARLSDVAPGTYVRLSVADTGTGIDPQTLPRIFEPFFTTKPRGKGTGLGLSTVYGIVRQSGGYLAVASELGVGTTFDVFLPWVEGECAVELPFATMTPAPRGGTETVLVVEDADAVRALAVRALRAAGYAVLEAGTGAEALRVADAHTGPLHLLVTDVVMPEFGGVELASRLQSRRPETVVLYISGYTGSTLGHAEVFDRAVNFLEKPFVPDELLRRVRRRLDSARGLGARAVDEPSIEPAPLLTEDLEPPTPALVRALRQAATTAHYDELRQLLNEVEQSSPGLKASLEPLVERLDYAAVLAALDRLSPAEGPHA